MDSKQHIEVTIRTAMLIKGLSDLIGAEDPAVMRLILGRAVQDFSDLSKFVNAVARTTAGGSPKPTP